jgi:hypothetical protein
VLYCTQMESIAVYCPLKRRLSEHGLNDQDYRVLVNQQELVPRVQEFFEFFNEMKSIPLQPITRSDYEILDVMSGGGKRLWYVTGAYIAKSIDSYFGRSELIDTIIRGPKSYFIAYEKIPLELRIL